MPGRVAPLPRFEGSIMSTTAALQHWLKNEMSGWRVWELGWLAFCCISIIALSLLMGDNGVGITAAVTGTLYALFAGKGKIGCYFFGIINTVTYGLISFKATLYGEVMLNWGWYLPMMFVGVICWRRHLDQRQIINKTALSGRGRLIAALLSLIGIAVYANVLARLGDTSPWLDSLTTVLSVTAMVLTVKRCIEQWLLWTVVNAASIYMWYLLYRTGSGSVAGLLMWCIALANGIIFFVQWSKEERSCRPTPP
ncbi:MAG: nicotinamide riboside transporter PnuC [Victivallaceae bacterium]|nr:nicotinamide riboside transporter PnuC [Victivallaceae bacterium]